MHSRKPKIFIVDDEQKICDAVAEVAQERYQVIGLTDPSQAVTMIRKERPALLLLDIMMPGTDGVALCKELRSHPATKHIPVIILTAASHLERRIEAFTVGADDFIAKPFEVEELFARIEAKLRRFREATYGNPKVFYCGNLYLNMDRQLVMIDDTPVHLSTLEFSLLAVLAKKQGKVITRKEIMRKVWGQKVVKEERLIDAHMVSLRKSLSSFDGELMTVYGKGYLIRSSMSPTSA